MCNHYKKYYWGVYILFSYQVFKIQMHFTLTGQLRPDTFQVFNSHLWTVATVLDDTNLDFIL